MGSTAFNRALGIGAGVPREGETLPLGGGLYDPLSGPQRDTHKGNTAGRLGLGVAPRVRLMILEG